jgi:hypothetical protein
MRSLGCRRVAKSIKAKGGASLAEADRCSAAATAYVFDARFVLMPKELSRKPPRRCDFRSAVFSRLRGEPIRSMVRKKQAHIVLPYPEIDAAVANSVELLSIPGEASRVVIDTKLKKRGV